MVRWTLHILRLWGCGKRLGGKWSHDHATSLGLALIVVLLLAPVPGGVHATSDISAKFDGRYRVSITVAEGMSGPGCQPFDVADVTIARGFLARSQPGAGPALDGFVTMEGFVTGQLRRPGAASLEFQGRFFDTGFRGGLIDTAAACAWLVAFDRQP